MNLKYIIVFSYLLWGNFALSQDHLPTDYLSAQFHRERREAFKKLLPSNSIAIFFSNPVQNRSNDVDYIFHQDPNLYYFTGYKEPNGVLILFSEPQYVGHQEVDEVLFVQDRDPKMEQWTGYRLGAADAKKKLGFQEVFTNKDFLMDKIDYSKYNKILLSKPKGAYTDNVNDSADSYDLFEYLLAKVNSLNSIRKTDSNPDLNQPQNSNSRMDTNVIWEIVAGLREIKTEDEMQLMRKAIKIAAVAQCEVMKAMHPNMSETEIQGIHEYIYKKYGSEAVGYPSIVGAGANGCVLHYIENNKTRVGNDLVLMDIGAEYHGYSADVTRTIPANGRFTEAQRTIYNLVLKAQNAAITDAVVGNDFSNLENASRSIINKGLMELGIIRSEEEGRKYYPHSVGHYLGLDVHDVSLKGKFKPNMVITVEPGIYIPEGSDCDPKWHGIAVRIEDDIHITEKGPINLSVDAPRTVEEIEELMKQSSVLNQLILPNLNTN
ncbi:MULTISPECIES: aminopeptidase P family protein [Aequorivita]|uniref:Xaa-Pro aminopeptidase n=1 Tax=Aequorivita iocasae TaxID=2803865 RepID=A0ABX7DMN5_9FLAO|nr:MULTISPECIES: aminopeptidase P family protein [Aequorivita]QQX75253.1 aminopeptidase P family protein [Aequorivita iocasae]UCA54701.1 aminopeptidase P family protein [Aequorivita sp. F7]